MENENKDPKAQLIDQLKQAKNVLVTVSRNPSVDQLSAAIGLTIMVNHLENKHATVVFSGEVPNTLEFLKPSETIEKTTDSLRDFIISLDMGKARQLRYKKDEANNVVRIFVTPYRAALTETDLSFSQGDFNVDVVVALGVHQKEDLDEAIINHGRILHDATVATVNTAGGAQLGAINWIDGKASSLSEMLVSVCEGVKAGSLDAQMATAFLTGIVAETARFSNEKTSSDTMNISAKLMAAGANQQLVATQLESPSGSSATASDTNEMPTARNDGSLDIAHDSDETLLVAVDEPKSDEPLSEAIQSENQGIEDKPSRLILEPPTLGAKLTANTEPEALDPSTDPLSQPPSESPLLSHDKDEVEAEANQVAGATDQIPTQAEETKDTATDEPTVYVAPEAPQMPIMDTPTDLPAPEVPQTEVPEQPTIEEGNSDVLNNDTSEPVAEPAVEEQVPDADTALAAAHEALDAVAAEEPLKPEAFNASGPMEIEHNEPSQPLPNPVAAEEPVLAEPSVVTIDPSTGALSYPTNLVPPSEGLPVDPTAATTQDPTSAPEPPPVPPPMTMPLMAPHEPPVGNPLDPNNLPPVQQ